MGFGWEGTQSNDIPTEDMHEPVVPPMAACFGNTHGHGAVLDPAKAARTPLGLKNTIQSGAVRGHCKSWGAIAVD